MRLPPDLLLNPSAAWTALSHKPAGLLTDVDGTLSPITDQPDRSVLHPVVPELLRRLSKRLDLVAVISGRPVSQLLPLVGVEGLVYVGNHGLEWWQDGRAVVVPQAEPFLEVIAEAVRELRGEIQLPGVLVEEKGASATIHYRLTDDPETARRTILETLSRAPSVRGLQLTEGRMTVNLLPPVSVDKGSAVERLARERGLRGALYLGDDVTDVDALLALRDLRRRGGIDSLGVAVGSTEAPADLMEAADCRLEGVEAVVSFLQATADHLDSTAGLRTVLRQPE